MVVPERLRARNSLEAELTQKIKKLKRRVNEKASGLAIRAQITVCAEAFDNLESAHYAWVEFLLEGKPDENSAKEYLKSTDDWLAQREKEYDEAIQLANALAAPAVEPTEKKTTPTEQSAAPSGGAMKLDLSEVVAHQLSARPIECMVFNDDPRKWKLYCREFDVNVLSVVTGESKRASYLLKFTSNNSLVESNFT